MNSSFRRNDEDLIAHPFACLINSASPSRSPVATEDDIKKSVIQGYVAGRESNAVHESTEEQNTTQPLPILDFVEMLILDWHTARRYIGRSMRVAVASTFRRFKASSG